MYGSSITIPVELPVPSPAGLGVLPNGNRLKIICFDVDALAELPDLLAGIDGEGGAA